ncbi:Aste57867_11736 [Aphanomyces stellatus]|uniref:Aste57867_11736 protein n=1 Tax=Aphanomyces stellatus TaxID=120398 RepID=A0A485KU15_9STRA|nr:hypothetical protein As57867_011692 [Aphanomyces stellatus]VFT88592.1 Aste57867_11736 [Aphanomyces stellatus]
MPLIADMLVGATHPPRGLSLTYFKHFVDAFGGREAFQDLTTEQVCRQFVIPFTKSTTLSLVDHVERFVFNGNLYVQPAAWFVSHAWSYVFLDVVDALDHFMDEHNLTNEKDTVGLWFCTFNNNQHKAREQSFLHWYTTFKTALIAIGNVVMVFSPWNNPTALTRSWCVCEVFVATESNARFEVAMTRHEKETFLQHVKKEGDIMGHMLGKINTAKSMTTFPSDREFIFKIIEQGPGFQKLDRTVFATLETWVVQTLDTQIALAPTADEHVEWLCVKGDLFHLKGAYADAEAVFQSAVAIYNHVGDRRPPFHWRAVMCLALARKRQYHAQEAWEPLFLDALVHQEELLGPSHDHMIETMIYLGESYCDVGAHIPGMRLLHRCYAAVIEAHPRMKQLSTVALSLGRALKTQKRLVEAHAYLEAAYNASKCSWGEDSFHTLTNGFELARCYSSQGKSATAFQLMNSVYQTQVRTLGPEAHGALISLRSLTLILSDQGDYRNAESNLVKCHACLLGLGEEGWAYDCLNVLGNIYLRLRKYTQAKAAIEATYAKYQEMFGPASAAIRIVMFARLLVAMECPNDVDTMDKISSLESRVLVADLQHETWTEHPCHGCLQPIQGTLYMCPTCPRYSLRFWQVCVDARKFDQSSPYLSVKCDRLVEIPFKLTALVLKWLDYVLQKACTLMYQHARTKQVVSINQPIVLYVLTSPIPRPNCH